MPEYRVKVTIFIEADDEEDAAEQTYAYIADVDGWIESVIHVEDI